MTKEYFLWTSLRYFFAINPIDFDINIKIKKTHIFPKYFSKKMDQNYYSQKKN